MNEVFAVPRCVLVYLVNEGMIELDYVKAIRISDGVLVCSTPESVECFVLKNVLRFSF